MINIPSHALNVDDVLECCVDTVPVNCRLEIAIGAHRLAMKTGRREFAEFCLRAVILAKMATIEDLQAQYRYLEDLPPTAWPDSDGMNAREATLDTVRRKISGMKLS